MILDDFERFCIHGVKKATLGRTKINVFWCIFAGHSTAYVSDHGTTGNRIFYDHFFVKFRRFWTIFASMAWAKQHGERQKWTRYDAFFSGRSTVCGFDHCKSGVHVFSCSFCDDFSCFLASFCMIWGTRLEAWSKCMNAPRSRSLIQGVLTTNAWNCWCFPFD